MGAASALPAMRDHTGFIQELSKALNVASSSSSSSSSDAINIASNQEGTAIASASAYDYSKLLEALHGIQEVFKSKEEEYCRENVQRCEGRTRVTGKNRKARIERSFKLKQAASCFDFRELSKALNVASSSSSSSSSDAINIASNQEGTAIASASAYDYSKLLEALHGIQEVFKSKEEEYCRENVQRCEGRTRVTGKNRKARIERRSQRQRLLFEKCQ
nr:hypothetical protein CFP56_62548 [Quercus suber]